MVTAALTPGVSCGLLGLLCILVMRHGGQLAPRVPWVFRR